MGGLKPENSTRGSSYKEIHKLHAMLEEANIPHVLEPWVDGWCLSYPSADESKCVLTAIQTSFSDGAEADRIEICGLLTVAERMRDSIAGRFTARRVFLRIQKHQNGVVIR